VATDVTAPRLTALVPWAADTTSAGGTDPVAGRRPSATPPSGSWSACSSKALTLLVQIVLKLEERDVQVGRSATLAARIEDVAWLPDRIESITSDIANIEERYARTVVPDALQRVLDGFEAQLHELERGHLYVDSYDPGIKIELLKQAPSIMRTTSLQGQDLEWHLSETGRRFWQFQLEALRRGWEIRRTFIYDSWVDDLERLAAKHEEAGVQVKRVPAGQLPPGLAVDVTIWGNTVAYEQRVRVDGTTTFDRFSVNEVDIRRCSDLFRRVEDLAEDY